MRYLKKFNENIGNDPFNKEDLYRIYNSIQRKHTSSFSQILVMPLPRYIFLSS